MDDMNGSFEVGGDTLKAENVNQMFWISLEGYPCIERFRYHISNRYHPVTPACPRSNAIVRTAYLSGPYIFSEKTVYFQSSRTIYFRILYTFRQRTVYFQFWDRIFSVRTVYFTCDPVGETLIFTGLSDMFSQIRQPKLI